MPKLVKFKLLLPNTLAHSDIVYQFIGNIVDKENWAMIEAAVKQLSEEDRDNLIDYFNYNIENLGETFVGEDMDREDFANFCRGLEYEEEQVLAKTFLESELLLMTDTDVQRLEATIRHR